jgi:hypothetical protein
VFSPRKLGAKAIATVGGIAALWGYLEGGREQVDYTSAPTAPRPKPWWKCTVAWSSGLA